MLLELEYKVLEVYRDLDAAVAEFAARTGLACPSGCGRCCISEKVEATVLECIPLAFELFRTGQAEFILKRLEENSGERQCVLYRPDFTAAGLWGCSQYGHRPVVCRLFGFAGYRGRDGLPRLAMCRVMKDRSGEIGAPCLTAEDLSAMPLFSDAGLAVTALHPSLGTVRLPINKALYEALQKVGMFLDLAVPETPAPENAPQQRQG